MLIDRRTKTIEVKVVTLSDISEKQLDALKYAVETALGEMVAGDYHYSALKELRDEMKAEPEADYWGR